ncbi:MAG TPA: serine hydrolase [Pyrinomonadaceae bacterium]|nr:serine hydrolase [Pyrinomonadaceae bacterium]
MKKRLTPRLALGLALLCLLAGRAAAQAEDKAARIDELMRAYHGFGQFNGAVLVAEGGRVVHKKGYGLANMEWNAPVEADTKFRLGSITKQFTAVLVLQLVQEGKLKLDGRVTDYLPDYRKDTGSRVTVHHLLNHTSGIPSYTGLPNFFKDVSRDPYTVADFVKTYASGDLEFEPGAKFNYNNSGYFLLGAIIERVTGKPYEAVLRERILDPLGMKDTGYDHHDTLIPKRASGYARTPAGYVNAPYLDMSLPYAAGSLYSTVEDLYLWDQALYTDKVLPAAVRELMFKPGLENYAYGWFATKEPLAPGAPPVAAVGHGGGINGFNTLIVRQPETKNLVVLLNNTGGAPLDHISRNIARILAGLPVEPPRQSVALALAKTAFERGAAEAVKQYRELKATQADKFDFSEGELNTLGYQLLGAGRVGDAVEIFKLNVEAYPGAFNTYDSLGEAYAVQGEKELAIKNYRRSLELNPQNTNAVERLKKLEAKQ